MWIFHKLKRWAMKLKGYRTWAVNILSTIMPILEMTEVTNIMPDRWEPFYAIGLALLNLYLRKITTTPLGSK